MFRSFWETFQLFPYVYLTGFLAAFLFPWVGIILVGTGRGSLGLAIGEGAALGSAVGLLLPLPYSRELLQGIFASLFALGTALFAGLGLARQQRRETNTLFFYLFLGSLTVLLLAPTPHGLEEVEQILMSTVLGATREEFLLLLACTLVLGGILLLKGETIELLLLDPLFAATTGVNLSLWDRILSMVTGITMGVALRAVGLTYMLAALLIPVLTADLLGRSLKGLFLWSPLLSLALAILGFFLGNAYDLPQTHTTIVLWGVTYLCSTLLVRLKRSPLLP